MGVIERFVDHLFFALHLKSSRNRFIWQLDHPWKNLFFLPGLNLVWFLFQDFIQINIIIKKYLYKKLTNTEYMQKWSGQEGNYWYQLINCLPKCVERKDFHCFREICHMNSFKEHNGTGRHDGKSLIGVELLASLGFPSLPSTRSWKRGATKWQAESLAKFHAVAKENGQLMGKWLSDSAFQLSPVKILSITML